MVLWQATIFALGAAVYHRSFESVCVSSAHHHTAVLMISTNETLACLPYHTILRSHGVVVKQDCSQAAELLREALGREQVKAKDLTQVSCMCSSHLIWRLDSPFHGETMCCTLQST